MLGTGRQYQREEVKDQSIEKCPQGASEMDEPSGGIKVRANMRKVKTVLITGNDRR